MKKVQNVSQTDGIHEIIMFNFQIVTSHYCLLPGPYL